MNHEWHIDAGGGFFLGDDDDLDGDWDKKGGDPQCGGSDFIGDDDNVLAPAIGDSGSAGIDPTDTIGGVETI